MEIDQSIIFVNDIICKNISKFSDERGFLSQNILAQLRNFVEYIACKIYAEENTCKLITNTYEFNSRAIKYLRSKNNFKFLSKFHDLLQKSVSHYTMNEDGSERLMLKYYYYLLKIKLFLKDKYNLDVLQNIQDFPLNTDKVLYDYYEEVVKKIDIPIDKRNMKLQSERYYINNIKPFFINQKIYYEITFTIAKDNVSKFDRLIAFSEHDILSNYSVRFSIRSEYVCILGKNINIQIIDNWEVSIRPCELENFANILLGNSFKISPNNSEYINLMNFLTKYFISLPELIKYSDTKYNNIKNKIIINKSYDKSFFYILDLCRYIIVKNMSGKNVLLYLLNNLNNKIIRSQFSNKQCEKLSGLFLKYGCIPFDEMPFCTSLMNHNPKIGILLECISSDDREYELFVRHIKNNIENKNMLFTNKKDIKGFENIDNFIEKYNKNLYYKHLDRKLNIFKDYIYIDGYVNDIKIIIEKLKELSSKNLSGYEKSVDSWLERNGYVIDCEFKKEILRKMFSNSLVALIYGSAGTGKTTLIKHISNFFTNHQKIFLSNTHTAVQNLKRRVDGTKSEFYTIKKAISSQKFVCDVLIIDECSTVSNNDMKQILEKISFKLLVLVGDTYQIQSIYFGNWFEIIKEFISNKAIFELNNPYRTKNKELLNAWKSVREGSDDILENLVKNNYVARLDESIFNKLEQDEIILCPNYGGLYGINNINRFLQNSNLNKSILLGNTLYKVGDPILFNESNKFAPLISNNYKGSIIDIDDNNMYIDFYVELDFSINEMQAEQYDFELIGESSYGNSIIKITVQKYKSTDEENDNLDTIVPFQVAYAISIHKSQGLEYKSIKIVISSELEEQITKNIFYTAITRTKEKLKIYCTPETGHNILNNFIKENSNKDRYLLESLCFSK